MKTILLLGPSLYLRELAVRHLINGGYRLAVVDMGASHPFFQLAGVAIVADMLNVDESKRTVIDTLARKGVIPDAVVTYGEWYVELAAELASHYGLPGVSPQTARICRDKYAMKAALRAAGVRVNRSIAIDSPEEYVNVRREGLRYPLVLKPLNYGGSDGVRKIDGEEDLLPAIDALHTTLASPRPLFQHVAFEKRRLVIEEYLDGPEYSVETLSLAGRHQILQITEKALGPEPDFFEVGHLAPAPLAEATRIRIEQYCAEVLTSLSIRNAICHIELRLVPDPSLIEIGVRPGGDRIMDLLWYSRGIDPYAALTAALLGEEPELKAIRCRPTAVRFLFARAKNLASYPSVAAVSRMLESLDGVEAWAYEPKLAASEEHPHRGDNRCGHIVISADDADELARRCSRLVSMLGCDAVSVGEPQPTRARLASRPNRLTDGPKEQE